MEIDYSSLSPKERYKLLVAAVTPRPIALVSTVDLQGRTNVAPFSFFNAISDDPPAVVIGVNASQPGHVKDTASNIRATGEFVVNLVDEAIAQGMNLSGGDHPPEVSEFDIAGFTPAPGVKVAAPRVAEAPISLECRRLANLELGIGRNVVVGEVIYMHVRDEFFDPEKRHIHADKIRLIARMHGAGWYARTTDLFNMPRA